MWSQSLTVFALAASLCSVCESAEINPTAIKTLLTSISTSTPGASTQSAINNNEKPIHIYQRALDHLLGRNGADKSAEKAANLFKTLAQQNWSSAQHMLGNMYYTGKGVEKNDLLAYKWLSLASKNNIQLAEAVQGKRKLLYSKLRASLSDQSFNSVEMWIAEWKPEGDMRQVN